MKKWQKRGQIGRKKVPGPSQASYKLNLEIFLPLLKSFCSSQFYKKCPNLAVILEKLTLSKYKMIFWSLEKMCFYCTFVRPLKSALETLQ